MTRYVVRHGGTPKQMRFWQSEARFRAFIGGLGSGKTRAGLIEVLRQPPSWGAVVAPVYQMLKDTIIPAVEEVASDLVSQINRSDMYVKFKNETTMLMRSADEPDRLRGPNLGWFWLDEPAQMSELVWKVMLGRIRVAPGRAWVTGTPAGKNWLYHKFIVEAANDKDFEMIHSTSYENIYLPEYYLKEMDKQYRGVFHNQEVRGEFVDWIDQPAYPSFSRNRNVVKGLMDRELRLDLPLAICCDFNYRMMCWPVGQVIDGAPRVLTEIHQQGAAQVRAMCSELRRQFPSHGAGLVFYGDASGGAGSSTSETSAWQQIDEEFRNYPGEVRFMVPRKNPAEKSRLAAVNDALSGQNGYWSLQLDEANCEVTINDLERVEMNQNGSGVLKVHDKDDERSMMTHASDALGYWIHMEWPTADVRDKMQDAIREAKEMSQSGWARSAKRKTEELDRNTLLYGL